MTYDMWAVDTSSPLENIGEERTCTIKIQLLGLVPRYCFEFPSFSIPWTPLNPGFNSLFRLNGCRWQNNKTENFELE